MYGLLLDSIQKFLREKYGERYWANIRRRAKLKNHWFVTHEVYSESVMSDLVEAAAAELGEDKDTVMMMFGEYFAENIGRYGYARLLRVLGRDLRDFLNGLDDLHEYLRISYPKMRPPSFLCEYETPEGMLLHYTTTRRGYLPYVVGQLTTIGRIYGKSLEIIIQSEETKENECHVVLDLRFDNREMLLPRRPSVLAMAETDFRIDSDTFLGIFPFCLMFNLDLVITRVGSKLQEVLPHLFGKVLNQAFVLRKPQFGQLNLHTIRMHTNCMFELISVDSITRYNHTIHHRASPGMEFSAPPPQLKLKGQMLFLTELNCIAFLCSPAMDSPEDLYESGIFINDLSMHDSSRDFILAGSQLNPELNLALSQEKIRSAQLEESIQRTDNLLYQMIPKPIADQLRNGETPLNTCQEFSSVSILFSDIVSFTPMCSRLRPMEVVCVLNAMYVAFDKLCEKHHVYKVETIGDAYMVISGAPVYTPHHAEYITNFAFSIIEATSKINDPSTNKSLKIRVGVHSGTVVAGVVGASILRYDVFGDTVNVAARMEATGEPMRIHISEATAELLQGANFTLKERGKVELKGKGLMDTYWVVGKKVEDKEEQVVLNPFQRFKQSSKQTPGSPSTPHTSSLLTTPTHPMRKRSASPKPDEWPEAERQLSRVEADRTRQRSCTVPTADILAADMRLLHTRHPSLVTPNRLLLQTSETEYTATSAADTSVSQSERSSVAAEQLQFASRNNSMVPDFNLMRIRDSLSIPLPTIVETGHPHLAFLAAAADENARSARQLADWLAELARSVARGKSRESSVDPEVLNEGTSVDPSPRHSVTESNPDNKPADSSVSTASSSKLNCKMM